MNHSVFVEPVAVYHNDFSSHGHRIGWYDSLNTDCFYKQSQPVNNQMISGKLSDWQLAHLYDRRWVSWTSSMNYSVIRMGKDAKAVDYDEGDHSLTFSYPFNLQRDHSLLHDFIVLLIWMNRTITSITMAIQQLWKWPSSLMTDLIWVQSNWKNLATGIRIMICRKYQSFSLDASRKFHFYQKLMFVKAWIR
jgi:hypothetical protein